MINKQEETPQIQTNNKQTASSFKERATCNGNLKKNSLNEENHKMTTSTSFGNFGILGTDKRGNSIKLRP